MSRIDNMIADIKSGNLTALVAKYSDMLLAGFLILALGLIIIPLPPFLLDILLALNISISITILFVAVYTQDPTRLAAFPAILLLTTLFRASLCISTARLILADAHAGQVVEAFGNTVAKGNPVVGFILFLIITTFLFVVVTKGAERVAEVGARFTLDAMPGKQMSIDGDLRSGSITQDQAKAKRADLARESQFHGAMDGAMKFVKGDAIFTIIVLLINIVGGLAIGVMMKGMEPLEALQLYTLLTIGDGLVSQIPAVAITLAAGFIVTRVATDDVESNVGRDIGAQMLAQPKALAVVAVLLGLLGLVPGMPMVQFLLLGLIGGAISFGLMRTKRMEREEGERAADEAQDAARQEPGLSLAVPVLVEVSESLTKLIDRNGDGGKTLQRLIPELRDSLYYELGVLVPPLKIRGNLPHQENTFTILLSGTPIHHGRIEPGKVLVAEPAENLALFQIPAEETTNPATGQPAAWIPEESADLARQAGMQVVDPAEVLVLHMAGFLKRYLHEFLGLQETQTMLEHLAQAYPKLVEEVVPKLISLHQLAEVLRRLVREGISIRDLKGILEAMSEWGRIESDPIALTELVRSSLARQICFKYARRDGRLIVYQIDPEIQQTVADSIRHTSTGKYIDIPPDMQMEILAAIRNQLGDRPPTAAKPVVLTEPEVRPFIRRLVEIEFPDAAVISMRELTPELIPQPIGVIALR